MLRDQMEDSDVKQELVTFAKLDNSDVYFSYFINNLHLLSLRVQKLCVCLCVRFNEGNAASVLSSVLKAACLELREIR